MKRLTQEQKFAREEFLTRIVTQNCVDRAKNSFKDKPITGKKVIEQFKAEFGATPDLRKTYARIKEIFALHGLNDKGNPKRGVSAVGKIEPSNGKVALLTSAYRRDAAESRYEVIEVEGEAKKVYDLIHRASEAGILPQVQRTLELMREKGLNRIDSFTDNYLVGAA